MRADGPPDTVTFRFRGRWEQYGTSDVSPDAIFDDFAAGSAFIASPAWIRDIFAAGRHSQCGQTAHLTQLHPVFAAGRKIQ